jgi:hypothetical protein
MSDNENRAPDKRTPGELEFPRSCRPGVAAVYFCRGLVAHEHASWNWHTQLLTAHDPSKGRRKALVKVESDG